MRPKVVSTKGNKKFFNKSGAKKPKNDEIYASSDDNELHSESFIKKSICTGNNEKRLQSDGTDTSSSDQEDLQNDSDDDGDYNNDGGHSEYSGEDTIDKTSNNPGWADAMRKILNTKKPKKKKSIVLSKAKKLCDVKTKNVLPFEIKKDDGGIIKEEITEEQKIEHLKESRKTKRIDLGIYQKPSIEETEKDVALRRIATKGVVQLFNAVRQQQVEIEKKIQAAGPLERKKDKVIKNMDRRAFLDVLMSGAKSVPLNDYEKPKEKTSEPEEVKTAKEGKIWNVLRDDFIMGAKLKDWNKGSESSAEEDMDII